MSNEKIWWYTKGEQRLGPHTSADMKSLAASGQISGSDMVWKEGLASWVPASSVSGLLGAAGGSPPPLPGGAETPRKMSVFTKILAGIFFGFWGLIFLGIMLDSDDDKDDVSASTATAQASDTEKKPASIPEPQAPIINVGDTFSTPTFSARIRSVQLRSSVGGEFFSSQPSEGGVYVVIVWEYKNISPKPVDAFGMPDIHLKAPDGTEYDSDLDATSSYATEINLDRKIFSDLNPGIQVSDAEVFEVSQELFDPASWKILIDADEEVEVQLPAQG